MAHVVDVKPQGVACNWPLWERVYFQWRRKYGERPPLEIRDALHVLTCEASGRVA